jgi:transglutaminase-like putative cysteine protease
MSNTDIIVERFDWPVIRPHSIIPMVVVYRNPKDYPGKFVARLFDADRATRFIFLADSYVELVDKLPVQQLVRMARHPTDDPAIVEVWM